MIKAVSRTKSKKFGSVAKDNHHFINVALVDKDYYSRPFSGQVITMESLLRRAFSVQ